MLSKSHSSLTPTTNSSKDNFYNQTLSPIYPAFNSHYQSTPNVAFCSDDQTEQRRLSEGPSLRLPNYNLHYPGEYGGSESCMLKQKNSSLTMLLDSTNSLVRTASTTLYSLFGAPRRASFCGEPDPTIQLSPSGNSGSLYLLPNSNESSLSNLSYEEQRRTVTIYDGRIPAAPSAPAIPFELMTPIDAITQTIDDPVESFVQIVLEEPDDRPSIILPLSSSSRRTSPSRHRNRSSSPRSSFIEGQVSTSEKHLSNAKSSSVTELFNSSEVYCQAPAIIEPMDFSFLEPVLRGESAAPPPTRTQNSRQISSENSCTNEYSTIDLHPPAYQITIINDDLLSTTSDNSNRYDPPLCSSRLKVPSLAD